MVIRVQSSTQAILSLDFPMKSHTPFQPLSQPPWVQFSSYDESDQRLVARLPIQALSEQSHDGRHCLVMTKILPYNLPLYTSLDKDTPIPKEAILQKPTPFSLVIRNDDHRMPVAVYIKARITRASSELLQRQNSLLNESGSCDGTIAHCHIFI